MGSVIWGFEGGMRLKYVGGASDYLGGCAMVLKERKERETMKGRGGGLR